MRPLACLLLVAAVAGPALATISALQERPREKTDEWRCASEAPWTELFATWTVTGKIGQWLDDGFYKLPLTADDAVALNQGWVKARQEEYTSLWCLDGDPRLCMRYDLQKSVAGVQVSFLQSDMAPAPYKWWEHPLIHNDTIFNIPVASGIYYFVSQDVLKSGGRASFVEIGDGLWLQSGNEFINVPQQEEELTPLGWTQESCIPTMGRHYYQNMSSTLDCQEMEPYFLLVNKFKKCVHGVGYQAFGERSKLNRQWEENVHFFDVLPTIPNSPWCLTDWAYKYGVLSVHVYFRGGPFLC